MSYTGWRSEPLPKGWGQKQRRILRRDAAICYICHMPGATHVDHIIPSSRKPSSQGGDEDSNLAAICRSCHMTKTASEARGGPRRRQPEPHPGLAHPPTRGTALVGNASGASR